MSTALEKLQKRSILAMAIGAILGLLIPLSIISCKESPYNVEYNKRKPDVLIVTSIDYIDGEKDICQYTILNESCEGCHYQIDGYIGALFVGDTVSLANTNKYAPRLTPQEAKNPEWVRKNRKTIEIMGDGLPTEKDIQLRNREYEIHGSIDRR